MTDFSIDMLASALKVSRRTIERCVVDGTLVPAPGVVATGGTGARQYHNRRFTFTAARVAELKARADTARGLGLKNIMRAVVADGPVTGPARYAPEPRLSPHAFIERALWKSQHTYRRRAKPALLALNSKPEART